MTLCREVWVLQRWEVPRPVKSRSGNGESNKGKIKDVQKNLRVSILNTKASCKFLLVRC